MIWHGDHYLANQGYRCFERFKATTFLLKKVTVLSPADLATFGFQNKVYSKGVNHVVGTLKTALTKDLLVVPVESELSTLTNIY